MGGFLLIAISIVYPSIFFRAVKSLARETDAVTTIVRSRKTSLMVGNFIVIIEPPS